MEDNREHHSGDERDENDFTRSVNPESSAERSTPQGGPPPPGYGNQGARPMGGPPMGGQYPQGPAPMGGPPMGGPHMGGPPMGGPPMGGPHMGGPPMGGPPMGGPHMGGPPMGGPHMGGPHMGGPHMGGPHMGGPPMGGPQMGGPQMGRPPMGGPPMGGPQMGGPGGMAPGYGHSPSPNPGPGGMAPGYGHSPSPNPGPGGMAPGYGHSPSPNPGPGGMAPGYGAAAVAGSAPGSKQGSGPEKDFEWVLCRDGKIPPMAVQAGLEKDGVPLYAARAFYKGGVHPGKAGSHLENGGFSFGWGGKEINLKEYYVLCGNSSKLRWVDVEGPMVLAASQRPVEVGHEESGEKLYLAKAYYKSSQQVGKAGAHLTSGMSFSYGKKEKNAKSYLVLCYV